MTNNKKEVRTQSHFNGVRDPIVDNAANGVSATMFSLTTDTNGSLAVAIPVTPFGLQGATVTTGASGTLATFASFQSTNPNLPWLYNTARNFERYRVTRCTLVFVGNVGSTATGKILLDSSTDIADTVTVQSLATGTGGRVYDLAASSSKELRLQCDVDTSWKKCSSRCFLTSNSASVLIPVNSANDLGFTNLFITLANAQASTNVGSLFLEYDVEFREPISFGANG